MKKKNVFLPVMAAALLVCLFVLMACSAAMTGNSGYKAKYAVEQSIKADKLANISRFENNGRKFNAGSKLEESAKNIKFK